MKRQGNEIVRLGQVATVEDGFAEPGSYSLRNGSPNVGLSIIRSREASTVTVAERVREEVKEINKTLPEGTKLESHPRRRRRSVADSLNNVIHALIFGAGLTIFVVYAFLNSWRSTLITGLSLPTSAIAAFIAVWLCGFTLNFMTLLGLSLAIGVLIDDAIVVRENIVRHMERGEDRITAARNGTAEIGLAVTATTFSIVAVFVPVAFMGGGAGEWFRPFAVTVVSSVLVSLFISFTLDPMLSAYWGDPPGHVDARAARPRQGVRSGSTRGSTTRRIDTARSSSGRCITASGWRWARSRCSSLALGYQGAFGRSEFLPKSDYGTLAIEVRTPSSDQSRIRAQQGGEGRRARARDSRRRSPPTAASTRPAAACGSTSATSPIARVRSAGARRATCARRLKALVGAEYVVLDDLNNGARKPVQIQFYGTDSRKLMELTNQFMDKDAADPRRRGRGPVRAGSEGRAAHRARSRTREPARHFGERRRADAARGVRGRRSGRLGGSRSANPATSRCACHPKIASTRPTSNTCRSRWPAPT